MRQMFIFVSNLNTYQFIILIRVYIGIKWTALRIVFPPRFVRCLVTHGAVRLVLPDWLFALVERLCAACFSGVFYENLATLLNEAKPSESAVHKRQFERVHNNVYEAKIQRDPFTFAPNMDDFVNDLSDWPVGDQPFQWVFEHWSASSVSAPIVFSQHTTLVKALLVLTVWTSPKVSHPVSFYSHYYWASMIS